MDGRSAHDDSLLAAGKDSVDPPRTGTVNNSQEATRGSEHDCLQVEQSAGGGCEAWWGGVMMTRRLRGEGLGG